MWLIKYDWDDILPEDYSNFLAEYYLKLIVINEIRIPRWIGWNSSDTCIEIHRFADALIKAYAFVKYLRIIRGKEVIFTLRSAKTRVAPTKTVSVPRLELCAAELLTESSKKFLGFMPIAKSTIHLWSDSKDVLFWL